MMSGVLAAATASARRSAIERSRVSAASIHAEAARRAPRGAAFGAALRQPGINVIAECKRRSPSRGVLRREYEPETIARGYAAAGAAAISVLTEATFFDGTLEHLRRVREAVSIPVLRKDFLSTEFQLLEARAAGADAVLLIVAALADADLGQLLERSRELDLAALVEVHDEQELTRAIDAGASIVGVNSRNLSTLEVDTGTFDRLASRLPSDVVAVAESGLREAGDLRRLKARRYDAFLIGERLMTMDEPGAALGVLLSAASEMRT
ncbi:MAG TPA: indole-3-glycerol phosphate synthase TrpC [Vicinamibacterales bacterium]|nr:indole-3-glycerol phosphate synthase TrpC [Vicinamibacterales bacterium]